MIKNLVFSLLVASLVFAILWIVLKQEMSKKADTEITYFEEFKKDNLDLWLEKLEQCESGGREIKVLDSNNKYSYDYLQFQRDTFIGFAKQLKVFPETEEKELDNLLRDRTSQFKVAKAMLLDNPENWEHWYLCSKKITPYKSS